MSKTAAAEPELDSENPGDSVCPVCHENSEIFAIGPCDHPICYRCSTRMRVVCSTTECPICRGKLPQIVFLTTKQKYAEVERRSCIPNRKHKILLEDESVEDAMEALLEICCKVCDTRPYFNSFHDLQTHMKRMHTLFACDLCVNHLKIFPYEHKFYTRKELATHRREGDRDKRSYRGHPLCEFCDERFMDKDELFRHLRHDHFFCHFCDTNEYFNDYKDLKVHFRAMHYLCEEGNCGRPDTRLTHAFATDIDLKAHVAAEHMGNKSKAEARAMKTIDVGFHMAPRRRGRDAGVVAPEDFEEVGDSNRGPRDRRNRRYNNRYDSQRNGNHTPPSEPEVQPVPEPPALDDFPTLGNCPPPFVPTALQRPQETVEDFPSLSTSTQSRSVAASAPSSLVSSSARLSKSSASAASQKPVVNFSSMASTITSSAASRPGSAQNRPAEAKRPAPASTANITQQAWAAPRLASGEDFPSLGGNRRGASSTDGPNLVSLGGAWTSQQKNGRSRPPSKRDGAESPPYNPLTSLASLGRSLCDDGDFPSLGGGGGGGAPKQATWVQKNNAKPAKKSTTGKSTPLGNYLNISYKKKGESVQLNGSSESKIDETKSKKNKKKKQKEKEVEAKKSTEDSGISLSSIASEFDAVISEKASSEKSEKESSSAQAEKESSSAHSETESSSALDSNPVPSNGYTAAAASEVEDKPEETEEWETVVGKKSFGFQEDDFPTLSAMPKKGRPVGSPAEYASKSKSVLTKTTKTFQDDFPSLSASAASQREVVGERGSGKKDRGGGGAKKPEPRLEEDDFPSLHTQAKPTRPPPGFPKAQVTAPPPGLGAHPPSSGKNPPGLNSTSSSSSSALSSVSQPSIPMAVKLKMYGYEHPPTEKERNSALVNQVKRLLILKDGGFQQFCDLSREFRSGQTSAQTYYKRCMDLFGEGRFVEVLPELLALLPDILKQHELAGAHSQSILGMCAPLSLMTCPTCHQYLRLEDSSLHFRAHANLGHDSDAAAVALPLKT